MKKKLSTLILGLCLVMTLSGCDEQTLSSMTTNPTIQSAVAKFLGSDDVSGDQLWQRDQLRDGTGDNCPNPDNPGDCDGSGPYGSSGNGGYDGSGNGDQQRLRDGSCL